MADDLMKHLPLILRPDPSRTVVRPFSPEYPGPFAIPGTSRAQVIVDRVLALDETEVAAERRKITNSLDERHRDVDDLLMRRYDGLGGLTIDRGKVRSDQALLIGAYFSEEYSFEAAALFNPSIVVHPDQGGVTEGDTRFILSLRAIGEGHVSSVTFRTGVIGADGSVAVDKASPSAVPPIIEHLERDGAASMRLSSSGSRDLSETLLFPMLPSQRRGIEDVRLVRFTEEDGSTLYYGTYTAFDGSDARSELLDTEDFLGFNMRPLTGNAAAAKGMALFPRRVGGRYTMLARQDNENIWLLQSDDLLHWEGGERIICPRYPWEFVQMGNCGSPIELDEGWLVLTHGVGTVRNYCMGAALLDKQDPRKVLARTPIPLIEPSPDERDGYVPNVVYSCGAIVLGRTLILPYGVADGFATVATADVGAVLAAMD